MADERIVELIRVPSRFEADALVAHLKSEDIPAYTAGSDIPGAYPGVQTQGAAVMIRERDLDRARAVIEAEDEP